MLLISPNFDVKSIIFPILARGLFPKLLEKPCKCHLLHIFGGLTLIFSFTVCIPEGYREWTARLCKEHENWINSWHPARTKRQSRRHVGLHARIQRDVSVVRTPWKITMLKDSLSILVRISRKSQSYPASIQCWATIGLPAKRHLNGIWLVGYDGPLLLLFGSPH